VDIRGIRSEQPKAIELPPRRQSAVFEIDRLSLWFAREVQARQPRADYTVDQLPVISPLSTD
jgi:hypothetical protein